MTDLLIDTSVALPLLLANHSARPMVRAAVRGLTLALAGHAFVETYAVLTRLPGDARVLPEDAARLLRERFEPAVSLDAKTLRKAPALLSTAGIAGGATYDGLIALAAKASGLPLASRDRRAEATYRKLDVSVEMLH